jgi:hypothetical protein
MNVFFSYSSKDKLVARRLAELLRSRGLSVWIDEGQLGPGDSLSAVLANAISQIGLFVLIITENSIASNWVKYELNLALSQMIEKDIKIVPLLFDNSKVPEPLNGMIWGDCRNDEGLNGSVNHILKSAGIVFPMGQSTIERRYHDRTPVNYGIRLFPTKEINELTALGKEERKYVFLGDYAEQCGRSLRQVLSNLWQGDAFDRVYNAHLEWTAIVFEVGQLNWSKLDVMPATWKAIYRILTDYKRLNLINASEEALTKMGFPPHDYYQGDQNYWYRQITSSERKPPDVGPFFVYPDHDLEKYFGVYWLCFRGCGMTFNDGGLKSDTVPSRIFLCKNVRLEALNYRTQNLGRVDDGVIVL